MNQLKYILASKKYIPNANKRCKGMTSKFLDSSYSFRIKGRQTHQCKNHISIDLLVDHQVDLWII